jgi:hypothetical protein
MKNLIALLISGALVVSGYSQTRNVLVGTNNAVVQPTNFWSGDASNARAGLGLGSAATNPASAFQPSSVILSNLASGEGSSLTNIAASNIVGTLSVGQGGTGATNAANARQNLGSTTVGDALFIATNAAAARTTIGALATNGDATNLINFPANILRTNGNGAGLTNLTAANITGLGTAATNPSTAFQSASSVLTNLSSSNAVNLTNLQATNIVGQIPASNIPSVNFSNVNGTLSVLSGGTGATNAATARTNLGLGWFALTNTDATNFRNAIGLGVTNVVRFESIELYQDGEITNSITYGADSLFFNQNGVEFFSIDGAAGGTIIVRKPILFLGTNASSNAAVSRTNLGMPWTGLTNTNAATFQAALFGSNTNPVLVDTGGSVVSPTNFWAVAPISTTVQYQTNVTGTSTNAATNSRNLFLFSLAPSVSGVTNTVTLPTNPATTFEGDRATITHLANSTNAVTAIRQLGAATNLITLNQLDEAVLLMYRNGAWMLADNISYIEPIYFSGTNAAANAAASRTNLGLGTTNSVSFQNVSLDAGQLNFSNGAIYWLGDLRYEPETQTFQGTVQIDNGSISLVGSNAASNIATTRTNLGLGLPALTNTNVTNFRTAIELGSTNSVSFSNITASGTLTSTGVVTTITNINVGGAINVTNKDESRTNLGIPLPALTNTNNANFRTAIELGATNNVSFSNVTASGTLTATGTVTATTNLVVNGFVDFSTNHTNSNPATNNQINDFIEIRVGTNQFWLPVYK